MNRPDPHECLHVINSVAPIRICDNGGWTDTWFAGHGRVFNIGVYPYVEVQIEVFPRSAQADRIVLYAENYGERYVVHPERPGWDRHPLLEAAIEYMHIPDDVSLQISIFSEAPAGCSTGTSAAVSVALIGALDSLTPGRMTPHEVAYAAHQIETDLRPICSSNSPGSRTSFARPTAGSISSTCTSTRTPLCRRSGCPIRRGGSSSAACCSSFSAGHTVRLPCTKK